MKVQNIIGICKCCGKRIQTAVISDDVDYTKYTLETYKAYKNIQVEKCPECNFVCDNLFIGNIPSDVKNIINSDDYQYVLNYEYIEEEVPREVWDYEIQAFNPNDYEAYAIVCDVVGEYENEIRALYKCITLKEKTIRHLRKIQYEECDDCDWSPEYNKIIEALEESIEINLDEICELITEIKNPNRFTEMIMIEVYSKMEEYKKAKNAYKTLKSQIQLPQDLDDYLKTILN